MARGKRRVVKKTSEQIKLEIQDLEKRLEQVTEELKSIKLQKKELAKDLAIAEAKEKAELEAQEIKSITDLMKEKGVSVEQLKDLLS